MGLFMYVDGYSIIFKYIYIKLSDYIRHSMKLYACFIYLKVNLRTTLRPPFLASWRTCDLQKTIDPLFTLTTCLKQTLSSSMKSRKKRDNYLFLFKQYAAAIVCLQYNHISTTLHNRRHSSCLYALFYQHGELMMIRFYGCFFLSSCLDFDSKKKETINNLSSFFLFYFAVTYHIIQTNINKHLDV